MSSRSVAVLAVLFVLALVTATLGATSTSSTLRLQKHPVIVTSQGASTSTVSELGTDGGGLATKRSVVHRWTVAGQQVNVLVRVQDAGGSVWIDLVADATITSLSTTVTALDLTTKAVGHPSPTKDPTDKVAMVSAGGS